MAVHFLCCGIPVPVHLSLPISVEECQSIWLESDWIDGLAGPLFQSIIQLSHESEFSRRFLHVCVCVFVRVSLGWILIKWLE